MKQVLSVQDLSCLGKCSLTVALPTFSAMGCSCAVLPTALLSTHTAFPSPHIRSLTGDMDAIRQHWNTTGVKFDAISVGYLSDPGQTAAVERVLEDFQTLTVIDPVMGDHGKLYRAITPEHVQAMAQLCRKGTVLLPNVTEAAFLTGIPYRENGDKAYYRELLEGMNGFGADTVIITGIAPEAGKTGIVGWDKELGEFRYISSRINRSCHGTGDLFAAVFTGALVQNHTVSEAATLAAKFVKRVISATPEATPFGINFEPQLPWLWEQL